MSERDDVCREHRKWGRLPCVGLKEMICTEATGGRGREDSESAMRNGGRGSWSRFE